MTDNVIQPLPPRDGRDWDCQCARCGSSCESDGCYTCGNDGFVDAGDCELEESYGDIDFIECPDCDGNPVVYRCLSSPEWCEANPVEGRENVPRGKIEWFVVREDH